MKPARGHNGGPALKRYNPEHLAQLKAALARVEAQIVEVQTSLEKEVGRTVSRYTNVQPWLYFPSRLAKSPSRRREVQAVAAAATIYAHERRVGQITHLSRKASRIRAAIALAEP